VLYLICVEGVSQTSVIKKKKSKHVFRIIYDVGHLG